MGTWLLQHRRSMLFLLLVLVLAGLMAAMKMPVALFPNVVFPRIEVSVNSGNMPIQQTEIAVTRPLEQALRAVPGVERIRSTTARGAADVSVQFAWGSNMTEALLQAESAVNKVLPALPPDTRFTARRMDPTVFPVLGLSLTSDRLDPVALRRYAEYDLRPLLLAIHGVAQVEVQGGARKEYQVVVDPMRLQSYGLRLTEVEQALSNGNVITAVGRLQRHYRLYQILSESPLKNVQDIRHIVLKTGKAGVVDLADVAEVRVGTAPQWTTVTANDKNAVLVNIKQQMGANTVAIDQDIRTLLRKDAKSIPAGIKLSTWYDQSQLITAAASSVRDAIFIGAALAALVLLVFLRNLRLTFIVAIVLPSVLLASVLILYVLHQSFNIMTLGGMAAAVGLVVDDAVVMLEHIMRRITDNPSEGKPVSVLHSALEMSKPLAGSSAATIIIFIPLAFLSGVTGAFFQALAISIAAALLVSFLVAYLAVPLLADLLLRPRDAEQAEHQGRFLAWFSRMYGHYLEKLLRRPLFLSLIVLAFLLLGGWSYTQVGSGFMPAMDEGGFVLDYTAAPGTSLAETDRLLDQVQQILAQNRDVASYSRRTGLQLGGGITEANTGDFFIRLKAQRQHSIWQVMQGVRAQIHNQVPGLRVQTGQLMEDLIGDLTAVPQPVEIKLFGADPQTLQKLARQVAGQIRQVSGVVEVFDGITIAGDAVDIHVDPVKAALAGMTPGQVSSQLQTLMEGRVVSRIPQGQEMIGVRVRAPHALWSEIHRLRQLPIIAPDGHYLTLGQVAEIRMQSGQAELNSENLKPMVAVTARIEGRAMSTVMGEVKVRLAHLQLPRGVYLQYGGLYREQQQSMRELALVLLAAILLVTVLLLFLYERFTVVLSILATALLALGSVFIGLWLTGTERNITAMIGMTMIVGIVTETAIFFFAEAQSAESHELVRAGKARLRPVLMTAIIAILALMPLALGMGAGAQMQAPLAIAIISGLLAEIPLVLLVMPGIYAWLERLSKKGSVRVIH
ncbi:transporter [Acidithiobacillus thiooxidans]|uniref:Transporter n=1 Tax=Acidithiobacillus thiooxidans TaxID=930 RepID=A0A1C2IFL7_ACITH|nr:efflux RND transporter permease subunit [Acidithiobacillus thiooxidans]OCX69280.1 transporter [Acidithiobacillus thiooxidans]OCX73589.1 transporter [Acidithiobacillus thiooxidans]OCX74779.1 transporter [Acidithiobacillus thiooxidans]OCX77819.1 transporter [Acidithiobacillus thiooxidans]OCX82379.1 transporter [Acidithiobacillus thiooxidans]